ncbi:MAG: Cadherin 4 protein [Magnetococcales bacterium]|nr:Cadherin 4 protein [Magnetococcales bacterium]HIJ83026.1 DUF4347 domain-containing protein [Magnetococcales bacterium]
MMFDASGFSDGMEASFHGDDAVRDHDGHGETHPLGRSVLQHLEEVGGAAATVGAGREIVFIDAGLTKGTDVFFKVVPGVRVVTLNPDQNGLTRMTEELAAERGLTAVHIVTHGGPGEMYLGNERLDAQSLRANTAALNSWKNALASGADILLYGCRVGEGAEGAAFLTALSHETDTQVAASTNDTGAHVRGGDWILETKTGSIETHLPWQADIDTFSGLLVAPGLRSTSATVTFTTDGTAVSLPDITIDADEKQTLMEVNLEFVGSHFSKADKLDFSDNHSVVGHWNEGVLTLMSKSGGPLTAAQFQAALNEVTYVYRHTGTEKSLTLADRTIHVTVADGENASAPLVLTLKQDTTTPPRTGLNFAPTQLEGGEASLLPGTGYVKDPEMGKESLASMFTKQGYLVVNLLGDRVDDPNVNDDNDPISKINNQGMAVVAVDDANGTWQHSTDGGTTWSGVEGVRPESALLLTGTDKDRIRFVPNRDFIGKSTIEFRAWDLRDADGVVVKTGGVTGVNTLKNGGTTPFSTEVAQWSFTMVPGASVTLKNQLVSTSASAAVSGDAPSHGSCLSDDGRYLVFASDAANLVSGDTNGYRDVFLRDNDTGKIQRVSNGMDGQANGPSDDPVISGDGGTVVFVSAATNLVAGDNNFRSDIFRYDMAGKNVDRVSLDSNATEANEASFSPAISSAGDRIVFVSRATNLVDRDGNDLEDVFLRDVTKKETIRLSVAVHQGQTNGASFDPAISGDGQWVAFASDASNVVTSDTNGLTDVFMMATTDPASVRRLQGSANPNGPSSHPDISEDGRRVVFASHASNLVAADSNDVSDIFLYERDKAGALSTLSLDARQGNANGASVRPSISADGHFVVFVSQATDIDNPGITASDGNHLADLFHRSIDTGQTVRISQHEKGIESNGPVVLSPGINGDGRWVSHVSTAGNLVDGISAVTTVQQLFLANVNIAPDLDPTSMNLQRIIAEPDARKGLGIADLLGQGFKDVNPITDQGVAVTGVSGEGSWQFSTDKGVNWSDLSQLSETSAILLKEDGQTRIRFIPESIPCDGAYVTFHAWDGTVGKNAQAGMGMNFKGGATAFSEKSVSVQWKVKTGKPEPSLDDHGSYDFRFIPQDNSGTTINALLGNHFSGSGPVRGVALTAADSTHGAWQYSSRGDFSDAVTLANLSSLSMTLLQADDWTRIRFVPGTAGFAGSVSLQFRAWDGAWGQHGDRGVHPEMLNFYNALGEKIIMATWTPNKDPVGVSDRFRVLTGQSLTLPVLTNDGDGDGDPLTVQGTSQPDLGRIHWDKEQSKIIYFAPDHAGTTEWNYFLSDGFSTASIPVTVSIEIVQPPSVRSGHERVRVGGDKPGGGEKMARPAVFSATHQSVDSRVLLADQTDTSLLPTVQTEKEKLFWGVGGFPGKSVVPGPKEVGETPTIGESGISDENRNHGPESTLPAQKVEPGPDLDGQRDLQVPESRSLGQEGDRVSPGAFDSTEENGKIPGVSGRQGFSRQIAEHSLRHMDWALASTRLVQWMREV